MLHESRLLPNASPSLSAGGNHFVIYGDPAYGRETHIIPPFKGTRLSEQEQAFNARMSKVRVCVEWEFGKIARYWAFVDFPKNQKLYLQRLGKMYAVAAVLSNVHTCVNGSQTANFFGIDPPTVEEYLGISE